MMESLLLGYHPKCSVYKREQTQGRVMWYISYHLPNKKRVQRPCHHTKKEAQRLMKVKELQLIQGQFDDKDWSKMPELREQSAQWKRQTIPEAIAFYLDTTAGDRNATSQYSDEIVLRRMFKVIQSFGRVHLDEVTPLDVKLLFRQLEKEGRKKATLKSYSQVLSKVFKWYIEDMEILEMRNPVKKVSLPKRGQLVRKRAEGPVTYAEVQALLTVDYQTKSRANTPIQAITKFIAYTGARRGEVLHAEWEDFDLDQGIWYIREKPHCPTFWGLGWSPKWEKERTIKLFPEALEVLRHQPRYPIVYGSVPIRDESGKRVGENWHPANFVFPKQEVWLEKGVRKTRYSRIDNPKRAWDTLKSKAGVSNLQMKDLRTFFNCVLKDHYHFTSKEAGSYIGNSEAVNEMHYSPVNDLSILHKMQSVPLNCILEGISGHQVN